MAILLTLSPEGDSETEFEEVPRSNPVVNNSVTIEGDEDEVIESVTCTVSGSQPDIVISTTLESVSITGTYLDPYEDVFTYVEKGSSSQLQTPSVVSGVANLPPQKDFFDLDQDTRNFVTVTYSVEVVHDLGTDNFELTQNIYNEWDAIYNVIDNYYD